MRKALLVAVAVLAVGYVAAAQRDGASSPLPAGSMAMVNSRQKATMLYPDSGVSTAHDELPSPGIGVAVRVIADPAPRGVPEYEPLGLVKGEADRWAWVRVLEGPAVGRTGVMLRAELRPIPR
jgi:hypothetical protein